MIDRVKIPHPVRSEFQRLLPGEQRWRQWRVGSCGSCSRHRPPLPPPPGPSGSSASPPASPLQARGTGERARRRNLEL